jgi:glycerophosphoryl diester phosphodiesterase
MSPRSIPFLLLASVLPALAQPARPLVVAHRGSSAYLPEHTLVAKAHAHALGADFIEQDIVLTKDDVPVVLHDIYLDAVTDVARRFPGRARPDGRYYALDFTLAEIRQLEVRERVNLKTGEAQYPARYPTAAAPNGLRIPTLEEELTLVQALNRSTGRVAGIYPEIKAPRWHRDQGRDPSRIVLPILVRFGYADKTAPCFLQCFEWEEVRRLRGELGWKGRLVQLIGGSGQGADGTDYGWLVSDAGLKAVAAVADGIGPALARVVTWPAAGQPAQVTDLSARARALGLAVHPYTVRRDDLPKHCPDLPALHAALFGQARVDGVFSDFPDLTLAYVRR